MKTQTTQLTALLVALALAFSPALAIAAESSAFAVAQNTTDQPSGLYPLLQRVFRQFFPKDMYRLEVSINPTTTNNHFLQDPIQPPPPPPIPYANVQAEVNILQDHFTDTSAGNLPSRTFRVEVSRPDGTVLAGREVEIKPLVAEPGTHAVARLVLPFYLDGHVIIPEDPGPFDFFLYVKAYRLQPIEKTRRWKLVATAIVKEPELTDGRLVK